MEKQTAVEWLRELYENRPAYEQFILDEEWEQAKEMEREQIIDAHKQGVTDEYGDTLDFSNDTSAEEYYNETYGNK